MTQEISITINCHRTHSNLLRINAEAEEGVRLDFLQTANSNGEANQVGLSQFISYAEYPELRDLVQVTSFDTIWDPDLLWSLATMHEDHLVTALGHYALHTDDAWQSDQPDFVNPTQQADVA